MTSSVEAVAEPRAGRSLRSLRSGGSAVADQILSSGTQLLLLVLVAKGSTSTTLGALSVGTLVYGFFLGAVGSLVGDVTLIRCRRAIDTGDGDAAVAEHARLGLMLATGMGLVCGGGYVVAALLIGGPVGRMLLLFGLAAPFCHGQDLLRSVAYGSGRIGHAALLDGTWMAVQVVASGVLLFTHHGSATTYVLAWAGGAAASLTLGWGQGRYRVSGRGLREWIAADGSRGLAFLGDFAVSTGVVQASFLAIGAIIPLAEFAAFRLAFVAVNPLANLMAGVRDLALARFAEGRGDRKLAFRRARQVAPIFAGISIVYGLAVSLPPTWVGRIVLGRTWGSARSLVGVVALSEVFRLSGFPAIDFLKVHGRPGALVRTRAVASAVLVPAIIVGGVVAGPRGAVWGAAGAVCFATTLWWLRAYHWAHDGADPVAGIGPPPGPVEPSPAGS